MHCFQFDSIGEFQISKNMVKTFTTYDTNVGYEKLLKYSWSSGFVRQVVS